MKKNKNTQRRSNLLSTIPTALLLLTSTQTTIADSSSVPQSCNCYLVSGPQPGYFTHHYFIDFRDLSSTLPPNATANSTTPSEISSSHTTGDEPLTNDYFSSSTWGNFWTINNSTGLTRWNDGGVVSQVASPQNIWISPPSADHDSSTNNTHLTLRTTRNSAFQSVAEFSSLEESMHYLSLRARIRIVPQNDSIAAQSVVDEGAVFGLFTYKSDTQESDLEILTREDTQTVRCSNQPDWDPKTGDEIEGASEAVPLPEEMKWTQWTDVRLDWFNGQSRWWAGGEEIRNSTKNVPTEPSAVFLNLWSNGGVWSGNMTVGGEAVVAVEWIEVAYNVSSDSGGGKCKVGCWVDGADVKEVGTPVLAFNATSVTGSGATVDMGWEGWLWMVSVGSALLVLL